MTQIPVPTEAVEARILMQYMKAKGLKFTHVKNETGRPVGDGKVRNWKAVWDAKDGVSPGFPDFAIVLPHIGLLLIELKRTKGGKVSPEQVDWVKALNSCPGVECHIAKGAAAGIAIIEELLANGKSAVLSHPDDGTVF